MTSRNHGCSWRPGVSKAQYEHLEVSNLCMLDITVEPSSPEKTSQSKRSTRAISKLGPFGNLTYGDFHKWGYPKMDGIYWKIPSKRGCFRGSPIFGNPHIHIGNSCKNWQAAVVHLFHWVALNKNPQKSRNPVATQSREAGYPK